MQAPGVMPEGEHDGAGMPPGSEGLPMNFPGGAPYMGAPSQPNPALESALRNFWASQQHEIEAMTTSPNEFKANNLPLARIKKIMKSDEDVRMIAAEAPILFARACEMFIYEITCRAWHSSDDAKRRTLQRSDIAAAIAKTDIFDFLVDIVPCTDPTVQQVAGMVPAPGMPMGVPPYMPPGSMPPGSMSPGQSMPMPGQSLPMPGHAPDGMGSAMPLPAEVPGGNQGPGVSGAQGDAVGRQLMPPMSGGFGAHEVPTMGGGGGDAVPMLGDFGDAGGMGGGLGRGMDGVGGGAGFG